MYVTRQPVSNWVKHVRARHALPLRERRAEESHRGRPRRLPALIDPWLRAGLAQDPQALGSRSTVWTAPVLRQYLRDAHAIRVSRQSVSLAWARLDGRWKRPRSRLAHRSATWRQAQGGSSAGSARARGPSSSCAMRPSSLRCLPSPSAMDAGGSTWPSLSQARMPGVCGTGCCISGGGPSCCGSQRPGSRRPIRPSSA